MSFPRSRNKFGAVPVSEGDMHFASTTEYDRWKYLELLERAGEIAELAFQPKVELEPGIAWKLDYLYIERGRRVWEDSKGRPATPRENLLYRLWRLHGPGLLRITCRGKGRGTWRVKKEIMGGGACIRPD
jgi:hypothetical protein